MAHAGSGELSAVATILAGRVALQSGAGPMKAGSRQAAFELARRDPR